MIACLYASDGMLGLWACVTDIALLLFVWLYEQHKSYAELPADLRCKILHNLCEAVIDDPSNT